MYLILILISFLSVFVVFHVILQNLFKNNFIKNFIISLFISILLFNIFLNKTNINLSHILILNVNIIFAQFVYLIIVQSFRSSIQIHILGNYKKINLKKLKQEELNIFKNRINILKKNNVIGQNKKNFYYKNKIVLTLTYYVFLIAKIIYNEKFI